MMAERANRSARANEFQVIWLVGYRLIAEASYDPAAFQEKHARHLMRVFLERAESILGQRTREPGSPDRRTQQMQEWVPTRKSERGMAIQRRVRIADTLHIREPVIIKVGPGTLRRTKIHENRSCPFRLNLLANAGNLIESLPAKSATKVTKKNEQDGGLVDDFEQRAPTLGMEFTENCDKLTGLCGMRCFWLHRTIPTQFRNNRQGFDNPHSILENLQTSLL